MSMMWVAVGTMAATSAYSAYSASSRANAQANAAQANADRRYKIQSGIAQDQMEEQQNMAMEKMTDISRAFLKARGTAKALQAETNVTGVSSERVKAITRTKYSEAKGKVAKEVNTNVINIARDMIAKKIDTEAIIAEAEASKQNVFTNTLLGAVSGAAQGYSLGKAISTASSTVGAKSGALGNTQQVSDIPLPDTMTFKLG